MVDRHIWTFLCETSTGGKAFLASEACYWVYIRNPENEPIHYEPLIRELITGTAGQFLAKEGLVSWE